MTDGEVSFGSIEPLRLRMHEAFDSDILAFVPEPKAASLIHPRLGIVGGGQLARMTAMAALQLGCDVVVLERNRFSPAATLATHSMVGDWDGAEALLEPRRAGGRHHPRKRIRGRRRTCCAGTTRDTVLPTARTVALVQDKFIQKQTLQSAGLPVPRLEAPRRAVRLPEAARRVRLATAAQGAAQRLRRQGQRHPALGRGHRRRPGRRLGGDGGPGAVRRGVLRLRHRTRGHHHPRARRRDGHLSRGRDRRSGTMSATWCGRPAPVAPDIAARAAEVARRAVEAVEAVGSFGVEMFLTRSRRHRRQRAGAAGPQLRPLHHRGVRVLAVRESRPRRARLAARLDPDGGARRGDGEPARYRAGPRSAGWVDRALAVPGAHVHLYGKAMSGAGRKMGHVTALGAHPAERRLPPRACAAAIDFGGRRMKTRSAPGRDPHGQRFRLADPPARGGACAEFGVACEVRVVSAHRTPDEMARYAKSAHRRGLRVIIAGAGGAAHLPGMVASHTPLPVIGVPVESTGPEGPRLAALDRADAGGGAGGHRGHRRRAQRRAAGRVDPGRA